MSRREWFDSLKPGHVAMWHNDLTLYVKGADGSFRRTLGGPPYAFTIGPRLWLTAADLRPVSAKGTRS